MNNYVILILGIWVINAIACFNKKKDINMSPAVVVTILIGFGYLVMHNK